MGNNAPHILVAGGGTGGHLFPALAIADEIKKLRPDAEFLFIGNKGKIEARVVPQRGHTFRTIWISGFHRRLTIDNLLFPLKVLVSLVQSFFVIRQFRPDVALGTGGYVCGPVLFVASTLKVPIVLHEANSYPGITTRMLASRATKIFIAFDDVKRWLKRTDRVTISGTPTREILGTVSPSVSREFFQLDPNKKTLLVFGGSLGATSVNNAVLETLDDLLHGGIQLIWQTGQTDFERVRSAIGTMSVGWVGVFIDRMEFAFAASDLVVCRGGATTLAELTRVGKPAIIIPYPHAAGDHQLHNARSLADAGAAVMIVDQDARQTLSSVALGLLRDPERLENMGRTSALLGKPEAGRLIATEILEMVR